jgi:hypothetical protein
VAILKDSLINQTVLQAGRFLVSVDLLQRRLADINDGFSTEVLGFDLAAVIELINRAIG